MFTKNKATRLTGKKLRQLNETISERDGQCCVVCGAWVEPGTKFHHEPCGINKQDKEQCGVLLCHACHYARHNGSNSTEIKNKAREYLAKIYG